jgi:Domain of unknown function (DUF4412)
MKKTILLATTLFATAFSISAQTGPMNDSGAALIKFFGANNTFSADCDLKVSSANQGEVMSGAMTYAMSVDKVRTEIDMTKMKSAQMPPAVLESMKKMGMGQAVSIARQDQKLVYLIYPGLKAYAKMPIGAGESATSAEPKIDKTKLGEETVDGHPCVKNRVSLTADNGEKHEAILWNATDMKDFPLEIQSTEQGMTALMHFKNINFAKPDAALFEPPAEFKAYDNVQQMMMTAMQKMPHPAPPAPGQ